MWARAGRLRGTARPTISGGGHAHCGTVIYQGDNWPEEYRNKLFTINFHGRRLNTERLDPTGCGFTGRREPDVMFFGDPWFRGIDLATGPDGGGLRARLERYRRVPQQHRREPHQRAHLQDHLRGRRENAAQRLGHQRAFAAGTCEAAPFGERLVRAAGEPAFAGKKRNTPGRVTKDEDLTAARAALARELDKGKNGALRLRALWTLRAHGRRGR